MHEMRPRLRPHHHRATDGAANRDEPVYRMRQRRGHTEGSVGQMTGSVDVVLSRLSNFGLVSSPEWPGVCSGSYNVLLEGRDAATEGVLRIIEPCLRQPVMWMRPRAVFTLPTGICNALLLQDVAALSREDQVGLLRWLDNANARTQVISTTARPLFPLVARGLFDASLYYRLNVILLPIDPTWVPKGQPVEMRAQGEREAR